MTPEQEIEKLIADQARRIADLEAALRTLCDSVERIAFASRAPNPMTPQLVERVQAARQLFWATKERSPNDCV